MPHHSIGQLQFAVERHRAKQSLLGSLPGLLVGGMHGHQGVATRERSPPPTAIASAPQRGQWTHPASFFLRPTRPPPCPPGERRTTSAHLLAGRAQGAHTALGATPDPAVLPRWHRLPCAPRFGQTTPRLDRRPKPASAAAGHPRSCHACPPAPGAWRQGTSPPHPSVGALDRRCAGTTPLRAPRPHCPQTKQEGRTCPSRAQTSACQPRCPRPPCFPPAPAPLQGPA